MLILEGPDGGGKTTLLNTLALDFELPIHPRFSTSTGGPLDNIYNRGRQDLLTWGDQELSLYDRHPMVSEPIYGAILRRDVDKNFYRTRASDTAFLGRGLMIFVLPGFSTVQANLGIEDQLDGVAENILKIYKAYVSRAATYRGHSFIYNYKDEGAYEKLHAKITWYLGYHEAMLEGNM